MLDIIKNINDALNGFIWGVPAMTCILVLSDPYRLPAPSQIRLCHKKHLGPHVRKEHCR